MQKEQAMSDGSDIYVMLGLRFSFQQVVVANEILDSAGVIRHYPK
jgi:hypothetical protein